MDGVSMDGILVTDSASLIEAERQRCAKALPAAQARAERLYQAARAASRSGRPGHAAWERYHAAQAKADELYLYS